ncbi:hypothetical protein RUND412_011378 [Rhizina undulata]
MQPQFYSSAAAHTQWAVVVPERPPYIEEPLVISQTPNKKSSFGGDWECTTARSGYNFASAEGPIRLRNDSGGMDEDGDVVRDVYYPHETPGGLQPSFVAPSQTGRNFPGLSSSFLEDDAMSEGEDDRDYDSVHSGEPEGDANVNSVACNNAADMEIDMDMEMDSVVTPVQHLQQHHHQQMASHSLPNACLVAPQQQSAQNRKRRWDDGSCANEVAGQPQIPNAVGNFAFDGASKRARVGA